MDASRHPVYPHLSNTISEVRLEEDLITADRKAGLAQLADFIRVRIDTGTPAKVVFICTHNSRRSHLGQIWCRTAAHVNGVSGIETYSGGTEATAFNPRAVAALERAGFRITPEDEGPNPRYAVRFSDDDEPMICFSKVYHQPPNPKDGFCAVMTCAEADEACPIVFGAADRIALRYEDPKEYDGTAVEAQRYDERSRRIAREMFFAYSLL